MTQPSPLTENLVHFVRYLRARGLSVVPQTSVDLLKATSMVGFGSDLYFALRSVCVARPEDIPVFDEAFRLFFGGSLPLPPPGRPEAGDLLRVKDSAPMKAVSLGEGDNHQTADVTRRAGWSSAERLADRDFGELSPEEAAAVRRSIALMRWGPSPVRTRRWERATRPGRPDLRRTLRKALSTEGAMLPLSFAERSRRLRPLLVLADVSGSMERYTEMFLRFAHAARSRWGTVEAFVFSTRLTRITRQLGRRDADAALAEVAGRVQDWAGGTRIGEALRAFNWEWSRQVTARGPVALVVSDGWDCGEPALLAEEMDRFVRSVSRVMWLNPLAGRAGYRPEARGMRTVLPFVDDFLPAASLADLGEVVRLLESMGRRERRSA